MSHSTKQKVLIMSGVGFMCAVAMYNSLYLPYYRRMDVKNIEPAAREMSRGSMWKNLDQEAKGSRKPRE